MKDFFNLYSHGFARLAVATPVVRVGDPQYNLEATLELMREAAREKAVLAVFPELGLSAYTCDDLFHQQALIEGAEEGLEILLRRTKGLPLAALIGLPVAEGYKGRAKDYTKTAEKLGLMLLIAGPDVVRLAPALVVSDAQIAEADRIMREAADAFIAG